MQSNSPASPSPHRHLLPHHHHHLLVLCPCKCHHNLHLHHQQQHQQLSTMSSLPHFHPLPPHAFQTLPTPQQPTQIQPSLLAVPTGDESLELPAAFPTEGLQENEWIEETDLEEEEEGDVFVLTDEWAEFFAKAEAKRRMAKQQKKRLK